MAFIGSRSDFKEETKGHPARRCSECRTLIAVGDKALVSMRGERVLKRVCGEDCRQAFEDRYWQRQADRRERKEEKPYGY